MTFSCKRCAYQWDAQKKDAPKDFVPKQCPHCKSTLWNKDYVRGPKKKIEVVVCLGIEGDSMRFGTVSTKEESGSKGHDSLTNPVQMWATPDDDKSPRIDHSYAELVRLAMEKLK